MLFFPVLAMFYGILLSNQTPINSELRRKIHSPLWAATISFTIGSISLGVINYIALGKVFPSLEFIQSNPLWIWTGGLLSVINVMSNILLFPILGAVQTVILPMLGQVLIGLVIDSFGWFGTSLIPMTSIRFFGSIIVICGVFVSVVLPSLLNKDFQKVEKKDKKKERSTLVNFARIIAIIAGTFSGSQQAVNGHLGVLLNAPLQSAFCSFFIGMVALIIISIVYHRSFIHVDPKTPLKAWNLSGGLLGAALVLISVTCIPKIGTGLTIIMGLIGQILGSLIVQQFGLWNSKQSNISKPQVIGIVIMIFGVILIKSLSI